MIGAGAIPNPPIPPAGFCCVSPGFALCWCTKLDRVVRAWAAGVLEVSAEHRDWLLEAIGPESPALWVGTMTGRDLAAELVRRWNEEA